MRKILKTSEGLRGKFIATFVKVGKRINFKGHSEDTILLKDIIDVSSKEYITDHLWFTYTKGFQSINLSSGVKIEFEARVKKYTKGYVNRNYGIDRRQDDFKLSHPTRIKVIVS